MGLAFRKMLRIAALGLLTQRAHAWVHNKLITEVGFEPPSHCGLQGPFQLFYDSMIQRQVINPGTTCNLKEWYVELAHIVDCGIEGYME